MLTQPITQRGRKTDPVWIKNNLVASYIHWYFPSNPELEQRITHWHAEVEAKHRDQTVLVVSHGEWLRALCNIVSGTISWQQGEGIMKNGLPMVLAPR